MIGEGPYQRWWGFLLACFFLGKFRIVGIAIAVEKISSWSIINNYFDF